MSKLILKSLKKQTELNIYSVLLGPRTPPVPSVPIKTVYYKPLIGPFQDHQKYLTDQNSKCIPSKLKFQAMTN